MALLNAHYPCRGNRRRANSSNHSGKNRCSRWTNCCNNTSYKRLKDRNCKNKNYRRWKDRKKRKQERIPIRRNHPLSLYKFLITGLAINFRPSRANPVLPARKIADSDSRVSASTGRKRDNCPRISAPCIAPRDTGSGQ